MRLAVTFVISLLLIGLALGPIFWLLLSSLKPTAEIVLDPMSLSFQPSLANYRKVLGETIFLRGLSLSLGLAASVATVAVSASVVMGYVVPLLRRRWRLIITMLVGLAYAFPPVLAAFPLFVGLNKLGFGSSFWPLWIGHVCLALPAVYWLIQSRFDEIPRRLEEILMLDGVSGLGLLWHVWLPALRSSIIATCVLSFSISAGDYVMARFLLLGSDMTLPLVLQQTIDLSEGDWGMVCASGSLALLILTLPILILSVLAGPQHVGGRRQ